jgi:hypothetical protein
MCNLRLVKCWQIINVMTFPPHSSHIVQSLDACKWVTARTAAILAIVRWAASKPENDDLFSWIQRTPTRCHPQLAMPTLRRLTERSQGRSFVTSESSPGSELTSHASSRCSRLNAFPRRTFSRLFWSRPPLATVPALANPKVRVFARPSQLRWTALAPTPSGPPATAVGIASQRTWHTEGETHTRAVKEFNPFGP